MVAVSETLLFMSPGGEKGAREEKSPSRGNNSSQVMFSFIILLLPDIFPRRSSPSMNFII